MNSTDQAWLENRIAAAVADDFYLDRTEERGIKEEAASRGFLVADTELILRTVLDKYGAVSERQLVDTLDKWLHQSTDADKKLDKKEERDSFDQVVRPSPGKKCGLDPRIAEEYVSSFCKVNGVTRSSNGNKLTTPLTVVLVLLMSGVVAAYVISGTPAKPTRASISSNVHKLDDRDRADIDNQLLRANEYVNAGQYTQPPERSAKACIDDIKRIDPEGTYKGSEVKDLTTKIVNQYISNADRAQKQGDIASARKWIDRAKLFYADVEVIRDKERELGISSAAE
jgi:hypothetical protein